MNDYRKMVRIAARDKSGELLLNGSVSHAAVLAEELVSSASKDISILTGNLDARVFGSEEFVDRVRQFLASNDRKIRVLIEHPKTVDSDDHLFMRNFASNEDVEVRSIPDDLKFDYHFMVADDDCYRFEKDKDKPVAIAAFGDRQAGQKLKGVFEGIWKLAVHKDTVEH